MSYEYKINIGRTYNSTTGTYTHGTDFDMNQIWSCTIHRASFESFGVGYTPSAEIDIVLKRWDDEQETDYGTEEYIPRMAEIIPYYRTAGSEEDWKQIGVFFLDERSIEPLTITLRGFDAMIKAEAQMIATGDFSDFWPADMTHVVDRICSLIGVTLDDDTLLADGYKIPYPSDRSMRELLHDVAVFNCGNWIITSRNTLLLIPLFEGQDPVEDNEIIERDYGLLINEEGSYITVGDCRIIVT